MTVIVWLLFSVMALALAWWVLASRKRKRHTVAAGLNAAITLPHSARFELYHNPMSLCSMKVRLCLSELGIDYRSHVVDLIETGCYENIRPHFLKVNPAGTVPVLVHDGHPIYESGRQIIYAAQQAPAGAPSLVPKDPELQQQMQFWMDYASLTEDPVEHLELRAGNCAPGLTFPLFCAMIREIPAWRIGEGVLFHFDKRRPFLFLALKLLGLKRMHWLLPAWKIFVQSREQMSVHMARLESHLQKTSGPWILGQQYTLADVAWLALFERFRQADCAEVFLNDSTPACREYWQALQQRPAYQAAVLDQPHPVLLSGTAHIQAVKLVDAVTAGRLEGGRSGRPDKVPA